MSKYTKALLVTILLMFSYSGNGTAAGNFGIIRIMNQDCTYFFTSDVNIVVHVPPLGIYRACNVWKDGGGSQKKYFLVHKLDSVPVQVDITAGKNTCIYEVFPESRKPIRVQAYDKVRCELEDKNNILSCECHKL